jgi:hypothetical protein
MKANRAVTSVVAAATALLVVAVGGSRAGAAEPEVVADWQLNESSSATDLADSSGNGVTGRIGTSVDTGVSSGGATVHRFNHIGTGDPADPERTHTVGDRPELDPGAGDNTFVVTIRYKATYTGRNMVQKGQSNTVGGMWKVEFEGGTGRARCLFRGANGATTVISSKGKASGDGLWHTLRCEKNAKGSTMTLDGVAQSRGTVVVGTLDNRSNLTIGGKGNCDNVTISCDYYVGEIDYIRIERGGSSVISTTTTTSTTTTSTTTTVRPTTTTTTTTTAPPPPPVRLPSGSFDQIDVDGRTIRVRGAANDPDGAPIVRIRSAWDGRSVWLDRASSGGRFDVSYTAEPGDHNVCIFLMDAPTGQAVSIGCKDAVVK